MREKKARSQGLQRQRGFTLMEAVLSIGIIALAATAVGAFTHIVAHASDSEIARVAVHQAADVATDLEAATMYDPGAISAITSGSWSTAGPTPMPSAQWLPVDYEPISYSASVSTSGGGVSELDVTYTFAEKQVGSVQIPVTQQAPGPSACPTPLLGSYC